MSSGESVWEVLNGFKDGFGLVLKQTLVQAAADAAFRARHGNADPFAVDQSVDLWPGT